MSIARLAAALLAGAALSAAAGPARAEERLYWGVTLLDPATETATENAWIVVVDGKVRRVGRGRPPRSIPAERRHDFRGRFLIPGLIDTHAHVTLGPVSVRAVDGAPRLAAAWDPAIVAFNGRMLLAWGVTTIRDPGGDTARTVAYARDERAGRVQGPEAVVAGLILDRARLPFDGLVHDVTTGGPIAEIVRRQAEAGVDYVKLYASLNEEDLAQAIAAARTNRVRTIGHLEGVSWTRAADLGIDSLVHMVPVHPDLLPPDRRDSYSRTTRHGSFSFFEWYEAVDLDGPEIREMIATLKARKVHLDATLIAFHLTFWGDDPVVRDADLAEAPPALVANWQGGFRFDAGWKPADYARAKAVWPKVLRLTRMLHEAGVPMTIGTDMANPFIAPGASLSREMKLHADAGVPNWAILRMATSDAARVLGLGDRTGRLRPGYEADAVFLDADPRRDILAVRRVAAVLDDGELLDPETLRREARSAVSP